ESAKHIFASSPSKGSLEKERISSISSLGSAAAPRNVEARGLYPWREKAKDREDESCLDDF
ncbi:Uncharacterized protein DAT39_018494, partial [Clarias magur]